MRVEETQNGEMETSRGRDGYGRTWQRVTVTGTSGNEGGKKLTTPDVDTIEGAGSETCGMPVLDFMPLINFRLGICSLLVLEALGKIFTDPRVDSYMPVDQLLGGLLGMLEALSTSALDMAPDILQVVLDSLTGLVPNPQFVSKLVSSGALPAVLGMLRSCDPLVTFKAEKLLAAVASTATRGRATLASSSAIQDMVCSAHPTSSTVCLWLRNIQKTDL